ncbi:MAG TPA: right-handed parallel beta-helix repeat-containing protein [Candidatus Thermoplasmatota archaeon]|nr:right-handed parallel beta-helix repeat-containing protein [Candidatus Thermoplasmatota archaeon]
MKKGTFYVLVCILTIISMIIPVSGTTSSEKTSQPLTTGNILYVGGSGPGNYSTIQGAINAANDGDTVFVYDDSSPYNENLIITKSIMLLGENKLTTVIHGDGYYYYQVISVTGQNIVISDFTIGNGAIGVLCEVNNSRISNLIIENTGCAIYLWKSSQNTISDNRMVSPSVYSIYVYDHSTKNIIVNNSLLGSSTNGINLYGSCDNNRIEKNSIENKENGIVIEWSFFNVIRNNNFINNTKQAYFENSSLNLFLRNYWSDWAVKKPRPIEGIRYGYFLQKSRAWTTYDFRPVQEPFAIPDMS